MSAIRIGVLGAARIAPKAIIEPCTQISGISVTAIAASSQSKAAQFAEQHRVQIAHASYRKLIESDDIDIVYIALPPSAHEKWAIAAMRAGKHVLCEKPFAMNAQQARNMTVVADGENRVLMEAFHYRFHPYFACAIELLDNGAVGRVHSIDASFDVHIPFAENEFRHVTALGGGALMDLGCYPVHWLRTLIGAEPIVESATCKISTSGVDLTTTATFRFPHNVTGRIQCSMDIDAGVAHAAEIEINGDAGRIILSNPIAPHNGNSIWLENSQGISEKSISGRSTYYYQLLHFLQVVNHRESPIIDTADAVLNMQAIDSIYEAGGVDRSRLETC